MLLRVLKLPVVHLLAALTAASVLHSRFPLGLGIPSFRWGMAAGIVLMIGAFAIAVSAFLVMRKHRTTVEPGQRPTSLVTRGVFGRSRNPIYLAMVLLVLAVALMTNGLWFVIAALVLAVVLDRVVIRSEERTIAEVFPDEYSAYKRRVRRWL